MIMQRRRYSVLLALGFLVFGALNFSVTHAQDEPLPELPGAIEDIPLQDLENIQMDEGEMPEGTQTQSERGVSDNLPPEMGTAATDQTGQGESIVDPAGTPEQTLGETTENAAATDETLYDDPALFDDKNYSSILFTFWELTSIDEALSGRGVSNLTNEFGESVDGEGMGVNGPEMEVVLRPPPEERELRLQGIVYNDENDWIIWLNETKIGPDAWPETVQDLKVYRNYIEVRWFDNYTNQIFPVRLRPRQRFNFDSRIFLPG